MGIGKDTIKNLAAELAGRPDALAELTEAQGALSMTVIAYHEAAHVAREKFAADRQVEFAPVLAAEVSKRLAEKTIETPVKIEAKKSSK